MKTICIDFDGVIHDNINYPLVRFKPHSYIYIDDRGIGFSGDWNKTIADIDNFKQWQEDEKNRAKRLKRNKNIPNIKG